jgi:hypothetical protein
VFDAATQQYGQQKLLKLLTLDIQACGGPQLTISDADGNTVATIAGNTFDNPAVHNPCDPTNDPATSFNGAISTIEIDLSTPLPYGGNDYDYENDYNWLAGYSVSVACLYSNKCQVTGTVYMYVSVIDFSVESVFADYPPSGGVKVSRPTYMGTILGGLANASSCWEVTSQRPFTTAEASAGLVGAMDATDPAIYQIIVGTDGGAYVTAFYASSDPKGIASLQNSSAYTIVKQNASSFSFLRLSAEVSRVLRTYEADVSQIVGADGIEEEGGMADPWPATKDDLAKYEVSIQITLDAKEVYSESEPEMMCAAPAGAINGYRSCVFFPFSGNLISAALFDFDVRISEEYYPFDDADAVQTMFTCVRANVRQWRTGFCACC